jgi:sugar/nucleoside kinase (ribokinase family)
VVKATARRSHGFVCKIVEPGGNHELAGAARRQSNCAPLAGRSFGPAGSVRAQRGCWRLVLDVLFHSPACASSAPETIDRGDAFLAALLASLLPGRTPADGLRRAGAAAAWSARQSDSTTPLAEGDITDMVDTAAAGRADAPAPAPA